MSTLSSACGHLEALRHMRTPATSEERCGKATRGVTRHPPGGGGGGGPLPYLWMGVKGSPGDGDGGAA